MATVTLVFAGAQLAPSWAVARVRAVMYVLRTEAHLSGVRTIEHDPLRVTPNNIK